MNTKIKQLEWIGVIVDPINADSWLIEEVSQELTVFQSSFGYIESYYDYLYDEKSFILEKEDLDGYDS